MISNHDYEYDVALSFAGEDRHYAAALATFLKSRDVKVFYDGYEKPFLWGKDLYTHLSDIYQNKARYCVMFLSKHYAAKVWTKHELRAAQARALKEKDEYILPVRLDDTDISGILSTIGYLNWSKETIETIAEAILKKLGVAQRVLEQKEAAILERKRLEHELEAAILERKRLEHELRVARLIQQTLLPKELPTLPGWQLHFYHQAASAMGGDFYDFHHYDDGRLGLVFGDVTDKGVPAALVMATTRSVLRTVVQGVRAPGKILEQVNERLFPDIPPRMFVTCCYALLDPASGKLRYANAGHDLPYYRRNDGSVHELRATGMPLGLMPGMKYEEKEMTLAPGENVFFYSDGLIEAHNPGHEMFGFVRLSKLLAEHVDDKDLIDFLLNQLHDFTGPDWEQEDDMTMILLQRSQIATRTVTQMDEAQNNGT